MPIYLIEGVEFFYRLIYALENEIYQIDFENNNEVIEVLREKCKKIINIQELFNIALKLKLSFYLFKKWY